MTERDGFLSRWSRRKVEAERPARVAPVQGETTAPGAPEARSALSPETAAPAEAAVVLSEEELAALPRVEDLTAETDLIQFMRAGVPPLLRNAALRQVWSLDPAIRDFVGEARDYAWDWNVPGGVPVSGPLLPGDDVETTLARMFSRRPGDEGETEPESAAEPSTGDVAGPTGGGGEDGPEPVAIAGDGVPESGQGAPSIVPATLVPERSAERPASFEPPRRRHGAAIPKLDSF